MSNDYEPDERYVQSLFARPRRPPKTEPLVVVAGHAFNGCDPAEADRLRWGKEEAR